MLSAIRAEGWGRDCILFAIEDRGDLVVKGFVLGGDWEGEGAVVAGFVKGDLWHILVNVPAIIYVCDFRVRVCCFVYDANFP